MGDFVTEGRTLTLTDPDAKPKAGDLVLVFVFDPETRAPLDLVVKHLEVIEGRTWLLCEQAPLEFDPAMMRILGVVVAKVCYPSGWFTRPAPLAEDEKLSPSQLATMLQWAAPALRYIAAHGLPSRRAA
jgi:hypothetical protein